VIAGGAGFRAQEFCNQYGIRLVLGVEGKVDEALKAFAEGKLQDGKGSCTPGSGKGYGIPKEVTLPLGAGFLGIILAIFTLGFLIREEFRESFEKLKKPTSIPLKFLDPKTQIERLRVDLVQARMRDYVYLDGVDLKKYYSQIRSPVIVSETK